MRDSLLAVSGVLDPAIGGPAASITEPPFSTRRTIYGFIDRQNLDGLYRTFDFAVPDATSPRRFVTTVPQQALFLMNSPFLHEQARQLTASIGAPPTGRLAAAVDRVRPAIRPRAFASSIAACWAGRPSPTSSAWRSSSSAGKPPRSLTRTRRLEAAHATPKADRPLSPWEQLSQVLLLTNEFMFVD